MERGAAVRGVGRRGWRGLWKPIVFGALALLVLLIAIGGPALPRFITEPIRQRLEANVNGQLVGYKAKIGNLAIRPFSLTVELIDLKIAQAAHPKPPVADFPRFAASVHWRAILAGQLVGDVIMDKPRLHVNLLQLEAEANDKVAVDERGWQDALREIYPLEINKFRIRDGAVTYLDSKEADPIELTDVDLVATNVRNVLSPDRTYPSQIDLNASVFGKGSLELHGQADFLAEPHPGMLVHVDLQGVPLAALEPALEHLNVGVRGGTLGGAGSVEYAPKVKKAHLENATVDGLDIDFLFAKARTGDGEDVVEAVGRSVDKATSDPDVIIQVDRVEARKSKLGIVNRDTDPQYRIFIAADELSVKDFTNQPGGKRSQIALDGKFMGSGTTKLRATFLPMAKTPDLDVNLAIANTDLRTLNPVFKAHPGFDVAGGRFSFYSQLAVRKGRIDGYVKPIFTDMDVYDERQERDDGVFQKLYEGIVGGASEILQNQPRDTVAARVDISGAVANPNANTAQILFSVLRNAFIKAIMPGLERHTKRGKQ